MKHPSIFQANLASSTASECLKPSGSAPNPVALTECEKTRPSEKQSGSSHAQNCTMPQLQREHMPTLKVPVVNQMLTWQGRLTREQPEHLSSEGNQLKQAVDSLGAKFQIDCGSQ